MAISTSTTKKGFTVFFAMLVGGLALAVGLAIYDLTVRELDLSSTATQSQYAIYAADSGAECALYWDFKCTQGTCTSGGAANSAFATGTQAVWPSSGIVCGTNGDGTPQDIATTWSVAQGGATATTTFSLTFSPQTYCTSVTVVKKSNPAITVVTSRGYNTCVTAGTVRLERVLQITY